MPDAISAKAGSLAIVALPRSARAARWSASSVGPRRAGGEHERIELLDVLAGLENEEVEKSRRGRHAGSDLVCKRGRATKLGRATGDVHRRAKLAHGGIEPDEDRARDHVVSDVELLDLRDRRDRARRSPS